jgi:chromosomal replication initiator protein
MTLWDRILASLQVKMNSQTFNTWLRPTQQLSVADGLLRVEVPSVHFADWINRNYMPLIRESARELEVGDLQYAFTSRDPGGRRPAPVSHGSPATQGMPLPTSEPPRPQAPPDRRPAFAVGESHAPARREPAPRSAPPPPPPATAQQPAPTGLNHRYTFDSFVVSSCNQFAHAAARAVAEQPAGAYNPLFIYGGVGLGKTHLMNAIGNGIGRGLPGTRLLYISAETFMTGLINAIRFEKTLDFKERYRGVDVLLIDDIQFLAGKERTQEEFFHTFNALHNADKQIVISSDRPPKQIATLEDRLRSRFEWGLITDVQPPDLETRIAILRKKSVADGLSVPDDVLSFIASKVQSNIRELEGALIRVTAFSSLNGSPIDLALAEIVLKDLFPDEGRHEVSVPIIMAETATYFGLTIEDLTGSNRSRLLVTARQMAMYLTRELTDLSLPKIGQAFGGRDHTTVMHATQKIRGLMRERRSIYNQVQELTNRVRVRAQQQDS